MQLLKAPLKSPWIGQENDGKCMLNVVFNEEGVKCAMQAEKIVGECIVKDLLQLGSQMISLWEDVGSSVGELNL